MNGTRWCTTDKSEMWLALPPHTLRLPRHALYRPALTTLLQSTASAGAGCLMRYIALRIESLQERVTAWKTLARTRTLPDSMDLSGSRLCKRVAGSMPLAESAEKASMVCMSDTRERAHSLFHALYSDPSPPFVRILPLTTSSREDDDVPTPKSVYVCVCVCVLIFAVHP